MGCGINRSRKILPNKLLFLCKSKPITIKGKFNLQENIDYGESNTDSLRIGEQKGIAKFYGIFFLKYCL